MEQRDNILKRAYLMYILLGLFGLAVLASVVKIMFVNGDEWRAKAENLTIKYRTIDAVRGNIYANDGSLLATSVPFYEIRFDPNAEAISSELFSENIDSLAWCLSDLFGDKSPYRYREDLVNARRQGKRYHLIKRNVKYTQLKEMRNFPIFNRGRYKGGFIYVQQNKRSRPFRKLARRTIGYDRGPGQSVGLEGAYSSELSGVSGKRLMQKIAGGVWMPVNDENEIEPEDGSDLITTIDINIQDVAQNALLKQLQLHNAQHGSVVLMEVETGEIRAIANLQKGDDGNYYEKYNFAVGASTDPGSTFKLASYLVALEDEVVDLDTKIETGDGNFKFYKETMKDSKKGGYGTIDVKTAFAVSSNIAIARIINENYGSNPQDFINKLYSLGLNKPLGLEIPGEGRPYIKSVNDSMWSGISLPWMSIGYEMEMTPLQMLTFYNGVANDGTVMRPLFVKQIRKHGDVVQTFEPQILKSRIASKETIDKLHQMLEAVVVEGTATNLAHADYRIAGKTGTAQIAKGSSGYDKTTHQASFCGYFPAEDPKYSCMVLVSAPSRNVYYGNLVAGPIFKEISDKVYSTSIRLHDELKQNQMANATRTSIPVSKSGYYTDLEEVFATLDVDYSMKSQDAWVRTNTGMDSVQVLGVHIEELQIPDVRGMSIEDALYLLENKGVKVQFSGRGAVKSQSLSPGTTIIRGQKITLTLA